MPADPPFDLAVVDRLLTTTKSVRRRLDLSRPVERSVLLECIRLAAYAPNASNAQDWRWVVVDDASQRAKIGALYRRVLEPRSTQMLKAKLAEGDDAGARVTRSVLYLAEHLAEVPAIVIPCYDIPAATRRYGRLLDPTTAPVTMDPAMFASILPAVWSFQLALRSRGLGSTLTTAHQFEQTEMADILGVPATWFQVALLPVGYVTGGDFRPSDRAPAEDTIIWNHGPGATSDRS
jgi:nitroreductase